LKGLRVSPGNTKPTLVPTCFPKPSDGVASVQHETKRWSGALYPASGGNVVYGSPA
jgi:hypothetical protein